MPHKHKRKRDDDKSSFDLPPSEQAKPLLAYKVPSIFTTDGEGRSNKRRKPSSANRTASEVADDTPKAFVRMMAWQKAGRVPKGLDDGVTKQSQKSQHKPSAINQQQPKTRSTPKAARSPTSASSPQIPSEPVVPIVAVGSAESARQESLKIRPHESLSSFAHRVNQSLPLSGVSRTANPNLPSDLKPKATLTKHNRKLQKLISSWRSDESRLRQRQADADDDAAEAREEDDLMWDDVFKAKMNRKGKKMKAGKIGLEDDPWKVLEKRRRAADKGEAEAQMGSEGRSVKGTRGGRRDRIRGLHAGDTVQAPPTLQALRNRFKSTPADFKAVDRRHMGTTSVNPKESDKGDVKVRGQKAFKGSGPRHKAGRESKGKWRSLGDVGVSRAIIT